MASHPTPRSPTLRSPRGPGAIPGDGFALPLARSVRPDGSAPRLARAHGLRLAAVLLVLVQLAGLAHLAFAPHGLCWEHGVVVELEGSAWAAVAEPTAAPGLDRNATAGIRGDAHPHCPALWLHRQLGPSRPAQPFLVASTSIERPAARTSALLPRWAALVRAPKQSPPV